MGDLFPAPGPKPWNLDAFGQPRWEKPIVKRTVQVERRPDDLGLELARLAAFNDRLIGQLRELDQTHVIDPASLTLETTTFDGQPVFRATFDAKPRTTID
ncbi:hypothetical protein [Glutamicibacter sp. 2E12]|uniref:hypothetical protein n=1 Tax=Glutamicibacter sp. 2E12 TaxID=3416181 RepID=UPI003CEB9928